jgi:hypothetical protein
MAGAFPYLKYQRRYFPCASQTLNDPHTLIEHKCEHIKKNCELRGDVGAIRRVLAPFFRKPQTSPKKEELFSQRMHLKIPVLSLGLRLSNPKAGCRVAAVHFLFK